MDIDKARSNGTDRVIVSANSPTSDLVEYWEDTYTDLERLEVLTSARRIIEDAIADAVSGARGAGVSWESIGRELETSKQAAQQRYGA